MTDAKGMPTYVVLDVSKSMKDHEPLLNQTLGNILNTLYTRPRISEFIQLSILTFSTEPNVVLRMTELRRLQHMPKITCGGSTNFGKVFALLRDRIEVDLPLLRDSGVAVVRPVVFLLTDGAPSDLPGEWEREHARLTDRDWKLYPQIISYGFGGAVESILKRMSTVQTYMADGSAADQAESLAQAMSTMLNSLVASAAVKDLRLPENVRGYRTISSEPLEL